MKKLKIGIFAFTSDEGCIMQILESLNSTFEELKDYLDIRHFRLLIPKKEMQKMDVAFIEGAISTKKDLELLKKIRENSKKIVAIGSCAINGVPSNMRNSFDEKTKSKIKSFLEKFEHFDTVEPIEKYIEVDEKINGCPISEENFIICLKKYIDEFGVKNA